VATRCHQVKKSTGRQVDKDHYLAANDIEESRIKHDLDKSAREEQQAADQYRDRGKYASGAGDRKTSELYEHVAGEEDQHKKEFQDRGQQLATQYSTTGEHLPQVFEGSKVLPFSHISEDVITWQGFFPDQILSVQVKGAVTRPKTVLETALKQSKAVVRNIVPDRELACASVWDNKVSWLSSIQFPQGKGMDVKAVEVVVYDIEGLSQLALEDVFKDSLAIIRQKEGPEKVAAQTRKYWVIVEKPGDSYFVEGSSVPFEEFEEERKKILDRGGKLPTIRIRFEEPSGNGNGHPENVPATNPGEPIPEKYRPLIPFIDEPLPPGADILVPAVVTEEGERKIDAVMRQLKDGVESIQDSSHFRLFLTTMSKFHNYSLGNQILIMLQQPEATRVAGFQTWKNLDRWVKKGASGIAILAPVMPPKEKQEKKDEEEADELTPTPVYFKVVHVFDISQTEGKQLLEFEVPVLTGEANEELFAKALALAKAQGVEVSFEPRPQQDPGIKGQFSGKSIWIKPDESKAQQLKSLLHEMAHYYSEGVFRIPRRDAETIAESAAFTVGAHYGFDSGVRSFPYVALWSQDKKVLQANLSSIRKVATVMLEGIEGGKMQEGKLIPALKPFEPYHFAEYVLRYNRFSDAEIPIYSGLTGRNPLRVPDHIWSEVITETEGEFIKQGEINVFHIPEKERPAYMRAAPTWRDITATIPSPMEEKEFICDSPELIPFTIDDIGYRDKLDNAFEAAIARAKGS